MDRKNGIVSYRLEGQKAPPERATNRQKKILRFFGVRFGPSITAGAAGWEIAICLSNADGRLRWMRYLYLTNDYGSDSDELLPCDTAALLTLAIPDNWSSSDAAQQFKEELIADILHDSSPFDSPMPHFVIEGHVFMFTGKFAFGSRDACQEAVSARGGRAPDRKGVSHHIDFLVIGTKGSTRWKKDAYGNKIEDALLARREHGSPAIISEDHWLSMFHEASPAASITSETNTEV